jgi:hypothetical protein
MMEADWRAHTKRGGCWLGVFLIVENSVADPDPGSGIGFFQIPDPEPKYF